MDIIQFLSQDSVHSMVKYQAFIQAFLSTAVFPQRFSFFTVCLVQWLRSLAPW